MLPRDSLSGRRSFHKNLRSSLRRFTDRIMEIPLWQDLCALQILLIASEREGYSRQTVGCEQEWGDYCRWSVRLQTRERSRTQGTSCLVRRGTWILDGSFDETNESASGDRAVSPILRQCESLDAGMFAVYARLARTWPKIPDRSNRDLLAYRSLIVENWILQRVPSAFAQEKE